MATMNWFPVVCSFLLIISYSFAVSIENLPFVEISRPSHFECLKSNSVEDLTVNLLLSNSNVEIDQNSKICIQIDGGKSNEKKCNKLESNQIHKPNNLSPGCHVILVWWESYDGLEVGSAHSVLVQVPDIDGHCYDTCTSQTAISPNIITGGCFNNDNCCNEGCCEFVNIASRCSIFNDGLPSCASCMTLTTKPSNQKLLSKEIFKNDKGSNSDNIFRPSPVEKIDGHIWPNSQTSSSLSMVGKRRLDHIESLVEDVILRNIPGDFVECGCWRGGVAALATAIFKSSNQLKTSIQESNTFQSIHSVQTEQEQKRVVWLLDSFEGLPVVNVESFPGDLPHLFEAQVANDAVLTSNSENSVKESFKRLELYDEVGTRFLQGFFKDSIPLALARGDLQSLSILRLDGDLYESTIQGLHYLYSSLNAGGHVVIDDFTDWVGCRRATADFRLVHDIKEPIQIVWHDVLKGEQVRGVWWTKLKEGIGYSKYTNLKPEDYYKLAKQLRTSA